MLLNTNYKRTLYSKDAKYVYYKDSLIEGADPESFKIIGEDIEHGVDKDHYYIRGSRSNSNPSEK